MITRPLVVSLALLLVFTAAGPLPGTCPAAEKTPIPFEANYKDQSMVFLLYEIEVELHEDWSYTTRQHKKLKVLKDDAAGMGEIPIPYDARREEITAFSAHTVTPSGERLGYAASRDLPAFEGYGMYADRMVRLIMMPAVSAGSLIDYEATVRTDGEPMKGQFWYAAELASEVPVREFVLTVSVPRASGIAFRGHGLDYEPTITDDGSTVRYRWHIRDLCTQADEEYAPPPRPDTMKNRVEFSSIRQWRQIADWYYALVQKSAGDDEPVAAAARELARVTDDPRGKVRVILEYIQEQFTYVMMPFGENTLVPHPAVEVFGEKYGDSTDLSVLLVTMLREVGIRAHVALFNFESAIADPSFHLPMPALFNHIIVEVDDPEGAYYVDPVLPGYAIGQYPAGYQGAWTFVITEDGGRFGRFPINTERGVYRRDERVISIAADGSAIVDWRSLYDLDTSVGIRRLWQNATEGARQRFQEASAGILAQGGRMVQNAFEGIEEKYGPVTNVVRFERPGMYAVTDNAIAVDVEPFERGDLFTRAERAKPVFYPYNSRTDRKTSLYIPEGFDVRHLPEGFTEDIGIFGMARQYRREDNRIDVYESEWYRRGELPAADYKKLQDFMTGLTAKSKQQILLERTF